MMKNTYLMIGLLFILMISLTACGAPGTVVVNTPASTSQPLPTDTPPNIAQDTSALQSAPMAESFSESHPAPVGSGVLVDNMKLVVTGKVRPADSIVAQGNMFTNTPEPDKEYMFVNIGALCQQTADKQCTFDTYNFKALGSDGVPNSFFQATGVDGMLKYITFNGGAAITGILNFLVAKSGTDIALVYQPASGEALYFALP
jgi:hypothetical protein